MRHIESTLQQTCVRWFRLQYPSLSRLLFAVPNGGARRKIEGAIMKAEGVLAGVSDLILLYPSAGFHALCIEMKTEKGRQQPSQKIFQQEVEKVGYKYIVCRSVDDFINEINEYIKTEGREDKPETHTKGVSAQREDDALLPQDTNKTSL